MKTVLRTVAPVFFLVIALMTVGVNLAAAQEPTAQQPGAAADNTKVNQRDQNQNEPTADQQKENPADRALSQQIRKSLMSDKSLSTYAHNVKIVTQNGQVTLKGPVRSEAEKEMIEQKATEVAGKQNVTSELDVKPQQ